MPSKGKEIENSENSHKAKYFTSYGGTQSQASTEAEMPSKGINELTSTPFQSAR